MEGVHPHDIGTILDEEGVAIRAGHHCAQPLMDHLGVPATERASFGIYNDESDVAALVRGIDSDPVKRRLTTLLVQLCADLKIGVVAEGVETQAERDTLSEIGCDLLQGYLFAKPSAPFPSPNWE